MLRFQYLSQLKHEPTERRKTKPRMANNQSDVWKCNENPRDFGHLRKSLISIRTLIYSNLMIIMLSCVLCDIHRINFIFKFQSLKINSQRSELRVPVEFNSY